MSASPGNAGVRRPSGLPLEVLDPAPVAVAAFAGERLRLWYMNDACRELFGERPHGTPAREAFADLSQRQYLDLLDRVFDSGEPALVSAAPVTVHYAHGGVQERYFSFSVSRLRLATGEWGVLCVAVEVTGHVTDALHAEAMAEERHRALRRYEALIVAGAQKLWVAGPEGHVTEHSPSWERITGRSWEEIQGDGWLGSAHPEDQEALTRAWFRAVAEVPELFEHVYRLRHADGSYRHCRLRAAPVREHERVVEWVGACADIEDEWLRERRSDLLGHAARAVAESSGAPEAFAALSRLIVPALADECGIYLLVDSADRPPADAPLTLQRVAATAREGLPPGLPPRREEFVGTQHALARAVYERHAMQAVFPPGEVPEGFAPPGVRPWLERTCAHSGAILPVLVDGVVVAVVSAFVCGDREPISTADRELMRELIEQAHGSLSHALQLQRTQRIARALQHSLLTSPPEVPGLRLAVRYLPSPTAAEVGGDWYDAFTLSDGAVMLVIGDVAGHDLRAAVTMSKMRNMLRGLAVDRMEPPGDILRRLDVSTRVLDPEEGTSTCVLARAEGDGRGGHQLYYSVAGHPPPLLVAPDGEARFLDDAQDVLLGGLLPGEPRNSAIRPLPPGGTLLLYTDGLVERRDEDLDQGLERLRHHAAALAGEPVESFCDRVLTEVALTGQDDIAMIALRLPPAGAPPGGSRA